MGVEDQDLILLCGRQFGAQNQIRVNAQHAGIFGKGALGVVIFVFLCGVVLASGSVDALSPGVFERREKRFGGVVPVLQCNLKYSIGSERARSQAGFYLTHGQVKRHTKQCARREPIETWMPQRRQHRACKPGGTISGGRARKRRRPSQRARRRIIEGREGSLNPPGIGRCVLVWCF